VLKKFHKRRTGQAEKLVEIARLRPAHQGLQGVSRHGWAKLEGTQVDAVRVVHAEFELACRV